MTKKINRKRGFIVWYNRLIEKDWKILFEVAVFVDRVHHELGEVAEAAIGSH